MTNKLYSIANVSINEPYPNIKDVTDLEIKLPKKTVTMQGESAVFSVGITKDVKEVLRPYDIVILPYPNRRPTNSSTFEVKGGDEISFEVTIVSPLVLQFEVTSDDDARRKVSLLESHFAANLHGYIHPERLFIKVVSEGEFREVPLRIHMSLTP